VIVAGGRVKPFQVRSAPANMLAASPLKAYIAPAFLDIVRR